MAKGSKSKRYGQRDTARIANYVADRTKPWSRTVGAYQPENFYKRPLSEVQDNRTWDPEDKPRAKTTSGGRPRIDVKSNTRKAAQAAKLFHPSSLVGEVTSRLGFKVPGTVIHCIRRAMRREVLFAIRKTRKGSGAKKRRRTDYSDIDC